MRAILIVPWVWVVASVPLGLFVARLLRASREAADASLGRPLARRLPTGNPIRPAIWGLALGLAALAAAATTTSELASTAGPGSSLWPVRLRLESLKVALQADPQARAMVHLRIAAERAAQLEALPGPNSDGGADVLAANLQSHVQAAAAALPGLAGATTPGAAELRARGFSAVYTEVAKLEHVVAQTCRASPTPECPAVQSALSTSTELLVALAPAPPAASPSAPPVAVGPPPAGSPPPLLGVAPAPGSSSPPSTEPPSGSPPAAASPPATTAPVTSPPVTTTPVPSPTSSPSPSPSPSPAGSSAPTPSAPPAAAPSQSPPAPTPAAASTSAPPPSPTP